VPKPTTPTRSLPCRASSCCALCSKSNGIAASSALTRSAPVRARPPGPHRPRFPPAEAPAWSRLRWEATSRTHRRAPVACAAAVCARWRLRHGMNERRHGAACCELCRTLIAPAANATIIERGSLWPGCLSAAHGRASRTDSSGAVQCAQAARMQATCSTRRTRLPPAARRQARQLTGLRLLGGCLQPSSQQSLC